MKRWLNQTSKLLLSIPEGTTVRCVEGSYADQWAQEHGCIPEYISAAIYLVRGSDGILRSYQNNEFVQYTGFVPMGQEVYYIVDGVQQKDLSGFAEIDGEWYLFAAGAIDSPKTNCTCYNSVSGEWWSGQLYSRADNREILMLARNGKFCSDYTGFCSNMLNNAPSYFVRNGVVDFSYTGLWFQKPTSSISTNNVTMGYFFQNGLFSTSYSYSGLFNDPEYGWWLVQYSMVNLSYTGLWNDPVYGWWLIDHGTIAWNYTGLWDDLQYGWWLIDGGTIAFGYDGLWNDPYVGWWLIEGGTVAWDYTGPYDEIGATWNIVNGQLLF